MLEVQRQGWSFREGLPICPNCSSQEVNRDLEKLSTGLPVELRFKESKEPFPTLSDYQEPKYRIDGGQLVNRQSGCAIPEDEPVMIFRARDVFAASILEEYARKLPGGMHKEAASIRALQFRNWAEMHPDRMKMPDTEIDAGWTVAGKVDEKVE